MKNSAGSCAATPSAGLFCPSYIYNGKLLQIVSGRFSPLKAMGWSGWVGTRGYEFVNERVSYTSAGTRLHGCCRYMTVYMGCFLAFTKVNIKSETTNKLILFLSLFIFTDVTQDIILLCKFLHVKLLLIWILIFT